MATQILRHPPSSILHPRIVTRWTSPSPTRTLRPHMRAATSPPDVVFLFAAAGFVLYIASRAAVDALTSIADPSPAKMAVAQCMPIAWTALLATAAGRSDVGIGIVFATSIAALALVLGIVTMMSQPRDAPVSGEPPPSARAWPFVIPAALLPLLAGFGGALTWWHALMMFLLGIAIWAVWSAASLHATARPPQTLRRDVRLRFVQFFLAILLAGLRAGLAFKANIPRDTPAR